MNLSFKQKFGIATIVLFVLYLALHLFYPFLPDIEMGKIVFFEVMATIFFVYAYYYIKK